MEKQRQAIDKIDKQIVQLLEQRLNLVEEVIVYKREHQLPVLDTGREKNIYEKIKKDIQNPAYEEVIVEVYHQILASSRNYQQEKR